MKTKRGAAEDRRGEFSSKKCRQAGVYSRINHRDWSTIKVENSSGRGDVFYAGQDGRAELVKPNIIKHKNIPPLARTG